MADTRGNLSTRETGGFSPGCRDERRELGTARRALVTPVLECLRCHRITLVNRDGERRLTEAMPLPHDTKPPAPSSPLSSQPSQIPSRGVKLTDPFVSRELARVVVYRANKSAVLCAF